MSAHSAIEWTDASWTPIRARHVDESGKVRFGHHCEHVSEACRYCYAERMNLRLGTGLPFKPGNLYHADRQQRAAAAKAKLFLDPKILHWPLHWKRPRKIFVCSMTDLFADFVPDDWIDQMFAVMALSPQHTFQVLTKRPARMKAWFEERWQGTPAQKIGGLHIPAGGETGRRNQIEAACEPFLNELGLVDTDDDSLWTADGSCKAMQWAWPLPNVWIGVSVEDQKTADERIPLLLSTPAAMRFISAEPLLAPVDITSIARRSAAGYMRPLDGRFNTINWVIAGGESGPHARPSNPEWFRSLRDQCAGAGVPFFFKQWGEWAWAPELLNFDEARKHACGRLHQMHSDGRTCVRVGKKAAGRQLDGREHSEFPT